MYPTHKRTFFLIAAVLTSFSYLTYAGGNPQNIAINEVFYKGNASQDWAELINRGTEPVDITGWRWCARFVYPAINQSSVLSGNPDLIIDPGEIIALAVNIDLNDNTSDFGLYTTSPFSNANNMVDFFQYGTSANVGRSDVAVTKDIWLETSLGVYDFVPTIANNDTVNWCGTESGGGFLTTSLDFINTTATQGMPNNVMSCDPIFINGFE